jgi:hypothetical protein
VSRYMWICVKISPIDARFIDALMNRPVLNYAYVVCLFFFFFFYRYRCVSRNRFYICIYLLCAKLWYEDLNIFILTYRAQRLHVWIHGHFILKVYRYIMCNANTKYIVTCTYMVYDTFLVRYARFIHIACGTNTCYTLQYGWISVIRKVYRYTYNVYVIH